MYSSKDLTEEIKKAISDTIANNHRVTSAWVTTAIANGHNLMQGKDSDFWKLVGIEGINSKVRAFINKLKLDGDTGQRQESLPFTETGYQYVQRFYFVQDPDNPEAGFIGISVHEMSDDQINLKVAELRKMAEGCMAHADELERYQKDRRVKRKGQGARGK